MRIIGDLSKLFVDNIFLIFVLWGLLHMLGFPSYEGGMCEITAFIAILYLNRISFNLVDLLILFYISYCLMTGIWGDVRSELFLYGIQYQLMPISFYFLARVPYFYDKKLLQNMRWPLSFAFISAIFLYFGMPSWYIEYKTQGMDLSGSTLMEYMRLSGFWPWPYFLGISSLFFIMYELYEVRVMQNKKKFYIPLLLLAIVVLLLTQLRVAIAFLCIYFMFLYFYSLRFNKEKIISLKWFGGIILLGGVVIFVILPQILDIETIEYILDKSIRSDSNIAAERVAMFSKYTKTITFLGVGLGAYSHQAIDLGMDAITDCDYIRIPNEIGLMGMSILVVILFIILCLAYKKLKTNYYEFYIIVFLFADMIGAAPLSLLALHPYMYWYCMGRVVSNNYKRNSHRLNRCSVL